MAHYFMDKAFIPGMVYNYIVSKSYDMILGVDIGHGENVIYKYIKDDKGQWSMSRVIMDKKDSAAVPSYIRYENNNVQIGKSVEKKLDFTSYFKTQPGNWDEPADLHGHSFGQLMKDFIKKLFDDCCIYDIQVAKAVEADRELESAIDGKLLIAVGCPASGEWTDAENMDKYIQLVHEATGCKNISIIPESTAAIMTPIFDGKKKIDLGKGVVIYDLGSSTIDFTYILMGKVLITKSLRIGGSDIDRGMLRKLLSDAGLDEADIPQDQMSKVYAQLRGDKEDFYDEGGNALPKSSLHLLKTDKNGYSIPDEYMDNSPGYTVDSRFMHSVLWEDKELVNIDDSGYEELSWGECCDRFFKISKGLIGKRPMETVILTGGTSYVSDVKKICEKYYGKRYRQEENPSASVARGLCHAKCLEVKANEALNDTRENLKTIADKKYESLITDFARFVFDRQWAVAAKAINPLDDGSWHKIKTITDALEDAMNNDPDMENDVSAKLLELYKKYGEECQEDIRTEINKLSEKIYGVQLSSVPLLDKVDVNFQTGALGRLDMRKLISNLNLTNTVLETAYGIIMSLLILACLFTANIPAAGLLVAADWGLGKAKDAIQMVCNKVNVPLAPRNLRKMVSKFSNDKYKKDQYDKNIVGIMKSIRADEQMRKLFDDIVNEQFEIALGKILFLVYEEKGA